MADFNALEALINAYIKQNGVQAITGQVLNGVLRGMVSALGKGWTIAEGDARPDTDPGTMTGPVAYVAHTAGTYVNFGGLIVNDGEVALLKYDEQTWTKEVLASLSAVATVDDQEGTPYVDTQFVNGVLTFAFHNIKGTSGHDGDAAGFGTVDATVDNTSGTPAVSVQSSGPNTAKNFTFAFTGLKGAAGVTSAVVTVDNTSGSPACAVSLVGQELHLDFTGLKGAQGDTGSSVDYPFTIVNNCTTNDPTQALSAAQGKVLKDELTQLEADLTDLDNAVNGYTETNETTTPQSVTANKYYNMNNDPPSQGTSSSGTYCAKIGVTPGEVYRITGLGGSAATRLWATTKSDGTRIATASNDVNTRTTPLDLTIPADCAYLYVNLTSYNSATDKIEKVGSTTVYHEGLEDRVEALESAELTVVDTLVSTSTTEPLSANQGRVLNEEINGTESETLTQQEITLGKTWNSNNNTIPSKSNLTDLEDNAVSYIYCSPGQKFRIYGNDGGTKYTRLWAIADENRDVLSKADYPLNARTTPVDLTIPEGGAILLVVYRNYASGTDKTYKVDMVQSDCIDKRINTLESKKDKPFPLTGKKVMFFGDSVTQFVYNGKGLVDYFADESQAICYKAAIGGSRLSQRATPVDTPTTETEARAALDICNMVKAWCEADYDKQDAAVTYLNDYAARVQAMKDLPIANADIVFFASGGNDLSAGVPFGNDDDTSLTTINGAINEIISMLLTANPKLKIYVYSPLVNYRNNTRDDAHWSDNWNYPAYDKTKPELIELLEKRVKAWHIPYINLYWNLGWNQLNFSTYYLSTDGTHPYKGFDVLGRRIYQQVISLIQ